MSILSLIYRTVGAWGAGKGSNLTAAEVDQNFYDLEQAVEGLAENPALPVEIDHISTSGNTFTVHMADATSFGPFDLPTAAFNYREEWQPLTDYAAADIFTTGFGLYFVNRDFTSGATFVPTLGAGVGGPLPYASLIMPFPTKVRVGWFWPTKPGFGLIGEVVGSDDAPVAMFGYLVADPFYIPADFDGSFSRLRAAATNATVYSITKNEVEFGTLSFAPGAVNGVFAFTESVDAVQFEEEDVLEMLPPEEIDDTARGLIVNIIGTLGVFEEASSS